MVITTVFAALLVLGIAAAVGVATARATTTRARRALAAEHEAARAELEAHRHADREATAALLRSVVAEERRAVDATVQTLVTVTGDKLQDQAAAGAQALDLRQQAIDQQVHAVTGELHQVRELVEAAHHHGELSQALADAAERHHALETTTGELHRALASPRARGQWGERMAEDVLRAAGMVDGVNYRTQRTMANGRRPDITFFLPRGLLLHMDVKFPIDNYLRVLDATNELDIERHRVQFLKDVRQRVKEITTRDYIDPDTTVDCVLLFIPNEAVYAYIHENDREIGELALRDRVILCSPYTLFGVLGVVRQAMDHFLLERTSDEILRGLGGLTAEWGKFTSQLDKVGRAVDTIQRAYDDLAGPRRRQFEKRLDHIDALRERHLPDDELAGGPTAAVDAASAATATTSDISGTVSLLREATG
jgi:DNA recombination protein RmuC